jgi:hypothetical protein
MGFSFLPRLRNASADGMLLPRMVLQLDDRVITQETHDTSLISFRDTDGDGLTALGTDAVFCGHMNGPVGRTASPFFQNSPKPDLLESPEDALGRRPQRNGTPPRVPSKPT